MGVRGVGPEREPVRPAVGLGLGTPKRQQRPDDAVLALRLDPGRAAARGQPVEDRLDLIGRGVAGRAQPIRRDAVAEVAQLRLRAAAPVADDNLRPKCS